MNIDSVIESNQSLIYKIASKFYGAEKEDLYQAGVLGIIKALKNYKPRENSKFSTYAFDYIYGEMYQLVCNKTIKINRDTLKLYYLIEKARIVLCQKLNKIPTTLDLAQFLNINQSEIEKAIIAGYQIESIDADSYKYENIKNEETSRIDNKILLSQSFTSLTEEEKEIIKARYYEDMTQSEVAKKLQMTQVKVSRYEKKSLEKMHTFLTN